ncbi:hypothetical protein BCV72DRAFT_304125 [Rhizopus microsporus var. microsporus]|uniref:FHA domain-containing protein n=1 Tax=Rhizopus microsporus var. microsporus TaxID=86635 RepID=A0A1X0R7P1_RHIZD|nr:hypothetical protein BCV72DRAFT_304125 [Rhizopus microsporus var. microsporus]
MWYLKYSIFVNGEEQQCIKALLPGKEYTVGKRDTNIVIRHDNSISKKHVTITVASMTVAGLEDVNHRPKLTVTDHETTYGTRLEGKLVQGSAPWHNDEIMQLGSLGFYMKVIWKPVIVCRNVVKSAEKKRLIKAAYQIGFNVLKKWNNQCTHLYMTELLVSDKLMHAMVTNRPIVSEKWLYSLIENGDVEEANRQTEPIILKDYGPLRKTIELVYNPNREELFDGIDFWIFDQAQYERIAFLIKLCHGNIRLVDMDTGIDVNDIKETTLFIQPSPELVASDRWIALEAQFCSNHRNVRTIPDAEIIYAVIYGSTHTMCNPRVSFDINNQRTSPSQSSSPDPSISHNPVEPAASYHDDSRRLAISTEQQEADTVPFNPSVDTIPISQNNHGPKVTYRGLQEADTVPFNPSATIPYSSSYTRRQIDITPPHTSQTASTDDQAHCDIASNHVDTLAIVSIPNHSKENKVPYNSCQLHAHTSKSIQAKPDSSDAAFEHKEDTLSQTPAAMLTDIFDLDEKIIPSETKLELESKQEDGSVSKTSACSQPSPQVEAVTLTLNVGDFFDDMIGNFDPLPAPSSPPPTTSRLPKPTVNRDELVENRQQDRMEEDGLVNTNTNTTNVQKPSSLTNEVSTADGDFDQNEPAAGQHSAADITNESTIVSNDAMSIDTPIDEAPDTTTAATAATTTVFESQASAHSQSDTVESTANTSTPSIRNIENRDQVIYAPLVKRPRPVDAHIQQQQQQQSSHGVVNYKRFRKTPQLRTGGNTRIVQTVGYNNRNEVEDTTRHSDASLFDPDVTIRVKKRVF